jgi:transposase-like protein
MATKRDQAADMIASGESVSETCRKLGIGRTTQHRWMKQEPARFKPEQDEHRRLLRSQMHDPNLSATDRREASKQLRELDAPKGASAPAGSGRIVVVQRDPTRDPTPRVVDGEPVPPEFVPPHFREATPEEAAREADLVLVLPGADVDMLSRLARMIPGFRSVNLNDQSVFIDEAANTEQVATLRKREIDKAVKFARA